MQTMATAGTATEAIGAIMAEITGTTAATRTTAATTTAVGTAECIGADGAGNRRSGAKNLTVQIQVPGLLRGLGFHGQKKTKGKEGK